MSFLNVIGDIGTVWSAADAAQQRAADLAWQEKQRQQMETAAARKAEMEQMALEEARRNQESAAKLRAIQLGTTAPQAATQVPLPNQLANDDEGNPNPIAMRNVAETAGKPDLYKFFNDRADTLMAYGKVDEADKERARAKAFKSEGLLELASGLHNGADVTEAIREYNARGLDRIPENARFDQTTGKLYYDRNGTPTVFDARNLLKSAKLAAEDKPTIIPQGSIAVDRSGSVIASNPGKPDNWKEKEDYKQNLAIALANHKATLSKQDRTALERNLDALKARGIAKDDAEAFDLLQESKGKSKAQFVTEYVSRAMQTRDPLAEPDMNKRRADAQAQASQIWDSANAGGKGARTNTAPAPVPGAKPAPNGKDYSSLF